MNRRVVRFVGKLCVNALNIVIVHKVIKPEPVWIASAHFIETFDCVCNFKIVVVVVAGVERLMKLVVCHGMECALVYPARIVAVNDLAHQPKIRLYFVRDTAQRFHKVKIQHVCGIETNTVHVKFAYPKTYDITDIILYRRISLV